MRVSRIVLLMLCPLGWALGAGTSPAVAASKGPQLTKLRCVPACKGAVKVSVGDAIALKGKRIARGQRATFRWKRGKATAKVVRVKGAAFAVKVPRKTPVGTVTLTVKDRKGRVSNGKKVKIVAPKVITAPSAPVTSTTIGAATGGNAVPAVFAGTSVWIWKLDQAEGGNVPAIIEKAKQAGVSTLFVKSSDGVTSEGSQFSRALVDELHAAGLRICAWQFIYGGNPVGEAAAAAEAIRAGADCFVINAEQQYDGRYAQAQQYLAALRAAPGVGNDYPLGFTSIGNTFARPTLPYSVFLGPRGGAQVAMPQVDWPAAKQPVSEVSREVAKGWRIYGRPMVPLAQIAGDATSADVQQFRAIWGQYGSVGTSYFRWGVGPADLWTTLPQPAPKLDPVGDPEWSLFQSGTTGDGARWAQQHLASFDPSISIDGEFGPGTADVVRRFQEARGLTPTTGGTGPRTWEALLKEPFTSVDWATGTRNQAP